MVAMRLRAYIKKTSMRLKCRRNKFTIKFDYASDHGCVLELHFFCTETSSYPPTFAEARSFSAYAEMEAEAGQDQFCECRAPDLSAVPLPDLTFTGREVFPLVVVIKPTGFEQAQVTYVKFQPDGDRLKAVPIRQRVVNAGRSMETMEMYGLRQEESEEAECIICLSEPKDTAILPCHHLCVCHGCAQLLLKHGSPECPICRQRSVNYVRIDITN